jgi:hypothetical protein
VIIAVVLAVAGSSSPQRAQARPHPRRGLPAPIVGQLEDAGVTPGWPPSSAARSRHGGLHPGVGRIGGVHGGVSFAESAPSTWALRSSPPPHPPRRTRRPRGRPRRRLHRRGHGPRRGGGRRAGYRLVTYWLPGLPGWLSFHCSAKRTHLTFRGGRPAPEAEAPRQHAGEQAEAGTADRVSGRCAGVDGRRPPARRRDRRRHRLGTDSATTGQREATAAARGRTVRACSCKCTPSSQRSQAAPRRNLDRLRRPPPGQAVNAASVRRTCGHELDHG